MLFETQNLHIFDDLTLSLKFDSESRVPHSPMIIRTFLKHDELPLAPPNASISPIVSYPPRIVAIVVIDTLRATSSLTCAIGACCLAVRPFATPEDVKKALNSNGGTLRKDREAGNVLVCGEQGGKKGPL